MNKTPQQAALRLLGLLCVAAASSLPGRAQDLSTCAEIDAALEGRPILEPDALWRYFPGTAEPSPGLEWTKPEFDDSGWREGPPPFVFGDTGTQAGTLVDEMADGVTTLYLRRVLDVPDPRAYARILLQIPVDDGYLFYLNGFEDDRLHAGKADERQAFDATATNERGVETRPVPTVDLTLKLKAGENLLALQGLVHAADAGVFAIEPRVWARYASTPEGERERVEALRERVASAYLPYLEGRHLQRLGELEAALPHFHEMASLDPAAPEPWERLMECYRRLGRAGELEPRLRELVRTGSDAPALLDVWARIFLVDLRHSPLEIAAVLPQDAQLPDAGFFGDARWIGAELGAGRAVRVDCGAVQDLGQDGSAWSKDRFFASGTSARRVRESDGVGALVRIASRSFDELVPAYSVPLPEGAFELRAHFTGSDGEPVAEGEGSLDLLVEGARVLAGYDPALNAGLRGVDSYRFPVYVADGFLDLDLVARTPRDPWIAGFEILPLTADAFAELAREWVARTQGGAAPALAQLAEAALLEGDLPAALELLERAERLPDFQPPDRARLASVRAKLLPQVRSFATAEQLARARSSEGEALVAAVREAAADGGVLAAYLAGRLHQAAGRVDEALAAFEELVASALEAPEPHVRMAECLVAAGLGPEAAGILDAALARGVEPTPELLQTWIALQLGALERDPWEVLEELRAFDPPDLLATVPTSEASAQTWRYTPLEPPANIWSRPDYDASGWEEGPAGFGVGQALASPARTLWNTDSLYAQRSFTLPGAGLLYPCLLVYANDAAGVYVNGVRVSFVGVRTDGYVTLPLRANAAAPIDDGPASTVLKEGLNVLGLNGLNVKDSGAVDAGIVQPLADLFWVADELARNGALRLDCGGAGCVAPDGTVWSADRFFGWAQPGGTDAGEPAPEIQGTENDALYRTHRWFYDDTKTSWYQIPLPSGSYRVTLHFAELDPDFAQPGARVFDVELEAQNVLERFDIAAAAGLRTACEREFEVEVRDGWLDLHLWDEHLRPLVCGVEIER